ncbi:hypothetical protein U1Q18_036011 [Sarracenia purpurea var. burkii]
MDNYNPSSPYPYNPAYGYPHVPPSYPHPNSGPYPPTYAPLIDDLSTNVHISVNATSVPTSPPTPAAPPVSCSPLSLNCSNAKYDTQGS